MGHQLSLSLELILLLNWFLKHGKDRLRGFIKEALDGELSQSLENISDRDYIKKLDQLHDTVLDFIIFLEDALLDGLDEVDSVTRQGIAQRERHKIEPIMQVLESRTLDTRTLLLNVQKAKKQCDLPEQEVKQELFKKMLDNWDPTTNEPIN